jgi:hypothetical protein
VAAVLALLAVGAAAGAAASRDECDKHLDAGGPMLSSSGSPP